MRPFYLVAGLALLVGCTPSPAADVPAPMGGDALSAPPVHALLGHRARLELSSAQVEALDSIGRVLHEQNAEPTRQLREMTRTPTTQQRPPDRTRRGDPRYPDRRQPAPAARRGVDREAVEELRETVRENNRSAIAGVAETLTPEQRAEVCRIFERQADRNDRRHARPVVWPWCAPESADEGEGARSEP